jgi:NADPH:quinone reductase-like Zn-dependent oxidoreductase
MNSPLRIRITVRGRLSTRLATAFDGMTLVQQTGATELVGEVVDQAQLHGLLTHIRDLGLELESVTVLSTRRSAAMAISTNGQKMMRRVVVDHFGGPEVVSVVQDEVPHPGPGEVRVRILAAGVSYTDAMLRAGSYLGVPKPPFTPGYELVGTVEELGPDCSRLRVGDRIGSLTVWGADAEHVCVLEENAVKVPEDVDPGEIMSLVFTHMTAYQLLHRTANVKPGETVLVHGAAGRVGTAVLELGAVAGLRMYGTASKRDREKVERLGATFIDYRNEDFLTQVHKLTDGEGVDVALDGFGGGLSLRSFRALRRGGRLVVFGHSGTVANGRKSWRGWIKWYAATAAVSLRGMFSPGRRVLVYRVQKLRKGHQWFPVSARHAALPVGGGPRNPGWFREDFDALLELLREDKIHPVVAERMALSDARRAHELLESSADKGKLVLVP